MSGSFRSQKTAMKEVVNAVKLLKETRGSTSADIYFILDNLHGRVKRNEIQKALRFAVSKGILTTQNQRYKLHTKNSPVKKRVNTRKSVGQRTARTGRSFSNYNSVRGFKCKSQRVKSRQSCVSSDYDEVPVQNFECKCLKEKSTRFCAKTKKSYSFKEIQNLLSCDCNTSSDTSYYSARSELSYSSAEPEPKRKRTNRQNKRKRPQPQKTIKLEQDSEETKQNTKEKGGEENADTTKETQQTEKRSVKKGKHTAEKSSDVEESQEIKKSEECQDSKANKKPCSSQQNNETNGEIDSTMDAPNSPLPRRSKRTSTAAKVKSEKSSVGTSGQLHQHRYQTRSKTKKDNDKS